MLANALSAGRECAEIDALKAQIVQMDVSRTVARSPQMRTLWSRSFSHPLSLSDFVKIESNKRQKKLIPIEGNRLNAYMDAIVASLGACPVCPLYHNRSFISVLI